MKKDNGRKQREGGLLLSLVTEANGHSIKILRWHIQIWWKNHFSSWQDTLKTKALGYFPYQSENWLRKKTHKRSAWRIWFIRSMNSKKLPLLPFMIEVESDEVNTLSGCHTVDQEAWIREWQIQDLSWHALFLKIVKGMEFFVADSQVNLERFD